ncbi:amidohydrolase [Emergencia timonensis]|uniref:amidohydrolase n=1 Tax=Emergencia timonensis TaxID=1776384 RepID=UPI003994DE5E
MKKGMNKEMIIKNGQIFIEQRGTFEALDIRIESEKIVEIGKNLQGGEVLDAKGCFITPGLIEAHSHIGMYEEGIQWEGDDICENEPVTPEMRAIDAFYPGDSAFLESLTGGVTTMCTGFGSGGVVAGTAVIVENNGALVADDMVLVADAGMKCALGENPRDFGRKGKQPNTRASVAFLLRQCLQDAVDYKAEKEAAARKGDHFKKNLGMEAMMDVIEGRMPIKAHCHRSDDICTVIRICKEFGVNATLDHCTDGHLIADHIKKSGYPAIVGPTFGSKSKYELRNKSFDTAAVLVKAGVKVAITTDHNVTPQESLNWLAAMYLRNGLSEADAIRCITCNPADILGIADRKGRLQTGLDGDVVIWDRHPLDIQAKPGLVYVRGKEVYRDVSVAPMIVKP